jgi:hypothetical protein
MLAIKVFSWICYGVGALGLLVGLVDGPFSLISFGVTLLVSGVFLQAIDYALNLLKEIRDAVVSEEPTQQPQKVTDENVDIGSQQKSMSELSAELAALSKKLDNV